MTFGLAVAMILQMPVLNEETNKNHISYTGHSQLPRNFKSKLSLIERRVPQKRKDMTQVNHHNKQHERLFYSHASNCDVHCTLYTVHCTQYVSHHLHLHNCSAIVAYYSAIMFPCKRIDCGLLKCSM